MSGAAKQLYDKLNEMGIKYEEITHEPVMTVAAQAEFVKHLPGATVKNLFLKDKKKQRYLITACVDSKTPMNAIEGAVGAKGLRMADDLEEHLGVKPGSVTPFAAMNIKDEAVKVCLDARIKGFEYVNAHPLHNEATTTVLTSDLLKFLESYGHKVTWIDGLAKDDGSSAAPQPKAKAAAEPKAKAKAKAKAAAKADGNEDTKGITIKKQDNFAEWYTQVIVRSEMIEYYEVSGCYILRPWAFFVWEQIQEWFDGEIKKLGVENAYFPLFVSKRALETEKDHVEGFSPEVAWVTRYGTSEMAEPVAIRPTSETIMYPAFAKWIRSHRDLPLKLNQWTSVVRWEFKQPTPFIRTREFLWQEGHTAHATDKECEEMVFKILDLYAAIYEDMLAVPMTKGIKSEKEKFAGGKMTTTIEGFIPTNGRAIQAATSHHLGQNFSKMFGIEFETEKHEKEFAHQASWGFTTRSIGVMIMTHADDKGLVMPPRVSPTQVVLIPLPFKDQPLDNMVNKCDEIFAALKDKGLRCEVDDRNNYTPGWKYNYWELKGVPLRIEVGPKDLEKGAARVVRRDTGASENIPFGELDTKIPALLDTVQKDMLARAKANYDEGIEKVTEWKDVMPALNRRHLVLVPWCETVESEEEMKKETGKEVPEDVVANDEEEGGAPALSGSMKCLCIPLEQPEMPAGTKCIWTGKPALRWALFGRSY